MSDRLGLLAMATDEGPLWEAEAWHAWQGPSEIGPLLLVAGPTRRPPRDLVLETFTLAYVQSFTHEPTDAERDALLGVDAR